MLRCLKSKLRKMIESKGETAPSLNLNDVNVEENDAAQSFAEKVQRFRYQMKVHAAPRQKTLHSFLKKDNASIHDFTKVEKPHIRSSKSKVSYNSITSRVTKYFEEKNNSVDQLHSESLTPLSFGHTIPKKKPLLMTASVSEDSRVRVSKRQFKSKVVHPEIAISIAKRHKPKFPLSDELMNVEPGFHHSNIGCQITPYLWISSFRTNVYYLIGNEGDLLSQQVPSISGELNMLRGVCTRIDDDNRYDIEQAGSCFGMSVFPTSDSGEESFTTLESDPIVNCEHDEKKVADNLLIPQVMCSSNISTFFRSPGGKKLYHYLWKNSNALRISSNDLLEILLKHGVYVSLDTLHSWLQERNVNFEK